MTTPRGGARPNAGRRSVFGHRAVLVRRSFRLPPDVWARLEALAAEWGTTREGAVARMLEERRGIAIPSAAELTRLRGVEARARSAVAHLALAGELLKRYGDEHHGDFTEAAAEILAALTSLPTPNPGAPTEPR